MRDKDIRRYLLPHLRQQHQSAGRLLIEEWGGLWDTRPDVACFEDHSFHAYEIKSDYDTLARLPKQLSGYAQVFDHLTVVHGTQHADKIQAVAPDWVGLLLVERGLLGAGRLRELRPARRSPLARSPELALHQAEMKRLLRAYGYSGHSKWQARQVYETVKHLRLPDQELLPYVRQCLARRYPPKPPTAR